jgi:hypothetical protein
VSPVSSIGVAHQPTALEVFAKGSMVWANDPNGPDALAVYADRRWAITKYLSAPSTPSTPPSPSSPPSTTPSTEPANSPTPVRPSRPPTRPSDGPRQLPGGPQQPPGGPQQPSPAPKDTARFVNLHNGSSVKRCQNVVISARLAPTKTLLVAHRRASPPDNTYYFTYAGPYRNGNVPANVTTTVWFGTQTGQTYDLYLLIMNVGDANTFWNAHVSSNGSFAYSPSLPGTSQTADRIRVVETDSSNC